MLAFEQLFDFFMDDVKELLFSDTIVEFFMDYSKNEILTLLFLSREREASMGQIATYIHAPLNTASGVVARLVKKQLVERIQAPDDRRIVLIALTETGQELVRKDKVMVEQFIGQIQEELTEDDIRILMVVVEKIIKVSRRAKRSEEEGNTVRRIVVE